MSEASYERQHLAVQAAGYINGAGTTAVAFGCQMTRFEAGHYALLLDASNGVVDDESFTRVQIKGAVPRSTTVEDISNVQKSIHVWDSGGSPDDSDIEVALYKTVTRQQV